MYSNLTAALQNLMREIVYGEITFVFVTFVVLIIFHRKFKGEFVQTKGVEAIMTLMTFTMLFFIPYLAITFSLTKTLFITIGLSVLLSVSLVLLGYFTLDNKSATN